MDKSPRAISTYALRDLLIEIIEDPSQWYNNQEFIAALKVQGKLAKWLDNERGIVPCSLNTLKTSAKDVLDGGYNRLDQFRINALDAIEGHVEQKNRSNKNTKMGLKKKVKELEREVLIVKQQNTILVHLVCDLKEKAAKYAMKAPDLTRAQCEKDMRGVEAKINFAANEDLFKALAERALDNE